MYRVYIEIAGTVDAPVKTARIASCGGVKVLAAIQSTALTMLKDQPRPGCVSPLEHDSTLLTLCYSVIGAAIEEGDGRVNYTNKVLSPRLSFQKKGLHGIVVIFLDAGASPSLSKQHLGPAYIAWSIHEPAR